jgi:hypothetical protein
MLAHGLGVGLTPVIPAIWEAEMEAHASRPAQAKKKKKVKTLS